jgi:hypothetical protein
MAIEKRLVAVLNTAEKAIGSGLLIDDDLVLTCAHVANSALGRGKDDKSLPAGKVCVHVPGSSSSVWATIDPTGWQPPPPTKNGGDLCVLNLPIGTATGLGLAPLREFADMKRPFDAAGFPENWNDIDYAEGTILGTNKDGLYMLASKARGATDSSIFSNNHRPAGVIHRGFSGGPVEAGGEIVGLLTLARPPKDATAYMIPVSAFGARFPFTHNTNRVSEKYSHVRTLYRELRKRLALLTARLDLRLRYCENFAEVFEVHRNSSADTEYVEGRDLRALELARVLRGDERVTFLHAPGGAGKSTFLYELLLAAPDVDLVPFLIEFSAGGDFPSSSLDLEAQLKSWFEKYGGYGKADKLLELAADPSDNLKPLLVIDGLNQISAWQTVLTNIDTLSKGALSGATIIVADRLVERSSVREEAFRHAVIPPLAPSAYAAVVESKYPNKVLEDAAWRPILASPIFLNLLMKAPKPAANSIPSRFQILSTHFRNECELSTEDLRTLADFAFAAYQDLHQTGIPQTYYDKFFDANPLKARVEDKGLIHRIGKGGTVEFRHQLLHDALAALKVASATIAEEEQLLRGPAFDVLSINSASPDAIELALEALQNPAELLAQRSDPLEPREFLDAVFDWNYWITLQCVASFDRRGDSPLPDWIRHAIYGHNLERRFDPYVHTSLRAERMKTLVPAELPYRNVDSRTEIRAKIAELVAKQPSLDPKEDEYRKEWLAVYRRETPFTRDDMRLFVRDSFIAWMTSNVVRRFENPPEVTRELAWMYEISRRTSDSVPKAAAFRWRLVHALGRGTPDGFDTLFAATLDPLENPNVRYGAVRSLVELAVTRAEKPERDKALARLHESLPELFKGDAARVRKELRRTCAFNEPYVEGRRGWLDDWMKSGIQQFITILRRGAELAESEQEAEIWGKWAATTSSIAGYMGKWEERKTKWLTIIDQDP